MRRTNDTDHFGAVVGQYHGGVRRWTERGEFNDSEARKGLASVAHRRLRRQLICPLYNVPGSARYEGLILPSGWRGPKGTA